MRLPLFWHPIICYVHLSGFPAFLKNTSTALFYLLSFSLSFEILLKCCLLHEAPPPPQWMNCLFLKSLTDPRSHVLLQQAQILLKRHLPVISYVTLGNNSFLDICFSICKMGIIVSALREIWGNLNCITHVRQRQNIKYIYSWCKYLLWASWREKRFCGDGCCFV